MTRERAVRDRIVAALSDHSWYDTADRQDWRERIANILAPIFAATTEPEVERALSVASVVHARHCVVDDGEHPISACQHADDFYDTADAALRAVRERVAGLLEDRARLYQRDDGEAGPLGFNQWGWRAIAEILRKEAAALRAVQGGE